MSPCIAIFGAGISGLTAAHILILRGFQVTIYESEPIIGGMARSSRETSSHIPTEHSWRGYAPFYHNLYNIIKQIPLVQNPNKSVFDNLSDPIRFHLLKDIHKSSHFTGPTISDWIKISYILGKYLFSDKRNKIKNYNTRIAPILKKYLSTQGYNFFINFLMGPGWGMDKDEASIGHYTKFTDFSIYSVWKSENFSKKRKWKVMKLPTQEAWFNPWEKFLRDKGVIFHTNTYLDRINTDNKIITSCSIHKKNSEINCLVTADDYLFCLNPFNLAQILEKSHIPKLYQLQTKANNRSHYEMIAFAIPLSRKINWEHPDTAYILVDGPLNITFYPQDQIWQPGTNLGKDIKSLWSGTCIVTNRIIDLYSKKGIHLSLEELKSEIIHEFLNSQDLQYLMNKYNETPLTHADLENIIVWYEWRSDEGVLIPEYKKYSNNIYNQFHRMNQKTHLNNGFLSGSHTKTSIDIWSMEGAVESGILTTNYVLDKYGKQPFSIYTHNRRKTIIHRIDNYLASISMPHIFDTVLIIIFIILIIGLILFVSKKYIMREPNTNYSNSKFL